MGTSRHAGGHLHDALGLPREVARCVRSPLAWTRRRVHSLPGPNVPISTSSDAPSAPSAEPSAAAAPRDVPQSYAGKKAVVVGAGPAGSTAAMFLARRGFQVDVFERRPEPSQDAVDTGRAYIIILIPRGQKALQELGVPLPTEGHCMSQGSVRHSRAGKVSISREAGNVTFSRAGLAQFLIDQARSRYADRIKFHFNAHCSKVDLEGRVAEFTTESTDATAATASTVRAGYDLIVGADGISSAVRSAMQSEDRAMTVEIADSGREYVTYRGLRGDIEPPEFSGNPGATLHLWASDDAWTSFTSHSDPDGTYSGTLSLKTGGFQALKTPSDFECLLTAKFKGIPEEWIPAVAQQAATQQPSPAGKRTKCSRLDGPSCVLIGDAAHSVTPVFGQGANSALESCLVLDRVLEGAGGDVAAVPAAFNEARLEDAHALQEVDRLAYSFFRRRGLLDVDFLALLAHVLLGTILSKVVPFLYGAKPALLQLGAGLPYSQILKAVRRDAAAAALGLAALGVWLGTRLAARLATGGAA